MCKRIKHGLQIILVGNIQQAKQPLKTPSPKFNSAGRFPERNKIKNQDGGCDYMVKV